MRLTVKYLQEQLENEKQNSNRYYKLWQEAENEIEKNKHSEMVYNNNIKNYESAEIYRLMEIIRILTKDPRLELIEDLNRYSSK
jgi:hypothetical protein